MEHKTVPQDVIDAALQTYSLEKSLMDSKEPNEIALSKAIEAAIYQYAARIEEGIAKAAEVYAEEFTEGDSTYIEGATLKWFAEKIRAELGTVNGGNRKYLPQDDDVVEVSMIGTVTVYEDVCDHCGTTATNPGWSVVDDVTGEEYHFMSEDITNGLRVRVLHRADDPTS